MYLDYLKERYATDQYLEGWQSYMTQEGIEQIIKPYGFITYKLQGDAVIIYDMYVKPAYRGHTYAWFLHDEVMKKATGKRVAITFSEFDGINHMAGIKAMKIAGFFPAFKTNTDFVFIKGI